MSIRKKAFVPNDALQRFMDAQLQKPENRDPDLNSLSRLNAQMDQVLFDPSYTTETKVKLFQDLLRRFNVIDTAVHASAAPVHLQPFAAAEAQRRQAAEPDQAPVQPAQAFPHQKPSLLRALGYIAKNRRSNASMLIDFLVQHPGISWTDDYKLMLQGNVYQKSNMFDLIKEMMRDSTRKTAMPPTGIGDLVQVMGRSNVPRDAVLNKDIKDYLNDDPTNLELSPYAQHILSDPGTSASSRRPLNYIQLTPRRHRGKGIKWKSY